MDEKKLLERLERQCARMEYCTRDIRLKVRKALPDDADAEERIVSSLVADGFLSDRRYAGAFAREKSSLQGWGRIKIAYMLKAKGIPRDTVEEALDEIEPEKATRKLERLLSEKARTLKGDSAIRLKLLRFGLSRGYSYDEVEAALPNIAL